MNPLVRLIGMEAIAMMRSDEYDADQLERWFDHVSELLESSPPALRHAAPVSVVVEPERGYDEWADAYDEGSSGDTTEGVELLEERAVRRALDRFPVGRVLDAGCGTGRHSAYLSARGCAVVGVDISSAMVERACARVPTGEFSLASIEALPYETASFPAAVCALAFGHLRDPRLAISELARVLLPGASLVISHLHPVATAVLRVQPTFIREDGSPAYVREHTHLHGQLLEAFRQSGLDVVACTEPGLDPEMARSLGPPLHAKAFELALVGLPIFVVWELKRSR